MAKGKPKKDRARAAEKWTQEENDLFLDLWLQDKALGTIAFELAREASTVDNHAWKLATGYEDYRNYSPIKRIDRSGMKHTLNDMKVISWGMKQAGKHRDQPVDISFLSKILARPVEEVKSMFDRRAKRARGFGLG